MGVMSVIRNPCSSLNIDFVLEVVTSREALSNSYVSCLIYGIAEEMGHGDEDEDDTDDEDDHRGHNHGPGEH